MNEAFSQPVGGVLGWWYTEDGKIVSEAGQIVKALKNGYAWLPDIDGSNKRHRVNPIQDLVKTCDALSNECCRLNDNLNAMCQQLSVQAAWLDAMADALEVVKAKQDKKAEDDSVMERKVLLLKRENDELREQLKLCGGLF